MGPNSMFSRVVFLLCSGQNMASVYVSVLYYQKEGILIYWDITGFFHRSTIPHDLIQNAPQPLGWGTPMAHLGSDMCNTAKYFNNHQIIFGKQLIHEV